MIHMHLLPFLKYHFIIHHSHPKWHASIFFSVCFSHYLLITSKRKIPSAWNYWNQPSVLLIISHFTEPYSLFFICIVLLTVASLITFQTYHKKVNHFNTLNQTPEIIVIVMNPSETFLSLSYPSAWSSRVISQSSIHEWATGLYPSKGKKEIAFSLFHGYIDWITAKKSDTLQWKFSERSHSRFPALFVFMAPVIKSNQTSLNSASLEFDNDFN